MRIKRLAIGSEYTRGERRISMLICIMMFLNLYGMYLQTISGVNSLVFTLVPFAVLLIIDISRGLKLRIKANIFLPYIISLAICLIHICVNFNIASIKCALYLIIFFLVSNLSNSATWRYLKIALVAISVVMCIDALVNVPYLLSIGYNLYNVRSYTMLDKPYYSLILTFAIVILIIDIAKHKIKQRLLAGILAGAFFAVNVFVIQTKASVICVAISIILALIFADRKMRRRILIVGSICVIAITVYYTVYPERIPEFLISLVEQLSQTLSLDSKYSETYIVRSDIYENAMKIFVKNPVLGIGFGNYAVEYSVSGVTDFESSWLEILVEGGLIYTVAHIAMLLVLFKSLVLRVRTRSSQDIQMLVLFLLYVVLNLQNDYMNVMYWSFLGIMYSQSSFSVSRYKGLNIAEQIA